MLTNKQIVEIAEDVIKNVENGRYIPTKGVYVNTWEVTPEYITIEDVIENIPQIDVCALGAMYFSYARMHKPENLNYLFYPPCGGFFGSQDCFDNSEHIFGKNLTNFTEYMFEGFKGYRNISDSYPDLKDRIIHVMGEVIKRCSQEVAV